MWSHLQAHAVSQQSSRAAPQILRLFVTANFDRRLVGVFLDELPPVRVNLPSQRLHLGVRVPLTQRVHCVACKWSECIHIIIHKHTYYTHTHLYI